MGGPHVTEMAMRLSGVTAARRHADAVALGEAEDLARIVEDAVRGTLKDVYAPVDDSGQERKPSLAALSGDSLGQNQAGPIQFAPGHIASAAQARGRWLGNLPNYSGGVRARLSLTDASFAP